MLMSFRIGANDLAKARQFYDDTFVALGGSPSALPETAPIALYRLPGGPALIVGPAANGQPATYANGGTALLIAQDEAAVDAWHAAGVAAGGSCEGPPGPRQQAGGRYGAYLRDPEGNKWGCYVGSLFA